jgi:hypothetical protein
MRRLARKGTMASVTQLQAGQCRDDCVRRLSRQWHHRREDGKSTNRIFSSVADGKAFGEDWGTSKGPAPFLGCRASAFRSIPLSDQWDKQRRREFGAQTKGNPHRGHKPGPGRSFLVRPVERFAEHPSELKRAFNIIDRTKSNFVEI